MLKQLQDVSDGTEREDVDCIYLAQTKHSFLAVVKDVNKLNY